MSASDPAPTPRRPFVKSRGLNFPKDQKFITGQIRGALREGVYERKEADNILKVAKPDDTVIELGAGIGFMSALVAKKVGVRAVHAFEANPHLIPYIERVYEANNIQNAKVTNAILGAEAGTADFYVRRNFIGSSLSPLDGENIESVEKIDILPTQSVFERIRPTVLICDIEGAEASLIPQMPLQNLRAAIVELHPQWIGRAGVKAVFDAMDAAGLTYWPRGSEAKVVTFRRDW